MDESFEDYLTLPEFIYRIVRFIGVCSDKIDMRLIALSIISYRYSNKFLKLTDPNLHYEIPILDPEQLSNVIEKLEDALFSYRKIYSMIDDDAPVYPLIKHIYSDMGIDVKNIKKMYKVMNKRLQPLMDELHIDNIVKYEFNDVYDCITIYTVKPFNPNRKYDECSIVSKDISIHILFVESQEMALPLIDRVVASITPIINNIADSKDSHHC